MDGLYLKDAKTLFDLIISSKLKDSMQYCVCDLVVTNEATILIKFLFCKHS